MHRLLPLVATAYGFHFTGQSLASRLHRLERKHVHGEHMSCLCLGACICVEGELTIAPTIAPVRHIAGPNRCLILVHKRGVGRQDRIRTGID